MTDRVYTRLRGLKLGIVLLGAMALGAGTASAQQNQASPSDAGASAAAPTANKSYRPELLIVGASTMKPYIDDVSTALLRDYEVPTPKTIYKGSKNGIDAFCAGVGPEYPDIAAASRGMHKDEFDRCVANGVVDIIEVKIGLTALYIVTKKGNEVFNVTPRMFFDGLAAELPGKDEFDANPSKTWRQLSKSAPDLPIRVILPDTATGTRAAFDSLVMQGGCRRVPQIMFIYAAADRVPKCVTLRKDGVVTDVPEPYGAKMVELLRQSAPGTLAVMAGEVYTQYKDYLSPLPVNGVMPGDVEIEDFDYDLATPNFFYFKRAHMRNNAGEGVVRGIREFMAEATSEPLISHGGSFSNHGLVTLTESEIQLERRKVRTLARFVR